MKKRAKTVAAAAVLSGVMLAMGSGCGSSSTSSDKNVTIATESFYGSAFSFILKGLAQGMTSYVGQGIMGDFLALLDGGNSASDPEAKALADIDSKLSNITRQLDTIQNDLKEILSELGADTDAILNAVSWPTEAVNHIFQATQDLQLLGVEANGTRIKPGEGNHTKIIALAADILGSKYDIPLGVTDIYNAINLNNPPALLSNYINEVMTANAIDNGDMLYKAYTGFEYFTSKLLNNQIKGVNLIVEAYKAQDDNSSAEQYLTCYDSDTYHLSTCNTLYDEVSDLGKTYSYIYNVFNLVLLNAPLYGQFLPDRTDDILQRAEFYRLLMTGTDPDKFGARFLTIRTADMPKAPDTLYAWDIFDENNTPYSTPCPGTHHTVQGRTYDYWDGNSVRPRTDYAVTEYDCGKPVRYRDTLAIAPCSDENCMNLGNIETYDYNSSYDINDTNGTIFYGLGVSTDDGRIDNRFTQHASLWHTQVPSADNYYSSYEIHMPGSWSIVTKAHGGDYESNARVELDGFFTYDGNESRTVHVDYDMQFYVDAYSPFTNALGGGDAYAYYKIGVWDHTASVGKVLGTDYRLHAGSGHNYSETKNVTDSMSFTAEPNHTYYVYINMISNVLNGNHDAQALSNLNKINYIRIRFDD